MPLAARSITGANVEQIWSTRPDLFPTDTALQARIALPAIAGHSSKIVAPAMNPPGIAASAVATPAHTGVKSSLLCERQSLSTSVLLPNKLAHRVTACVAALGSGTGTL